MPAVAPSTIALFSIFLYNCINAMMAYLTNILQMSMLQLITIQAVPSLIGCSIYITISKTPGGILGPPGTRLALWAMAILATLATLPILFSLNLLTLSEHVSVNCLLPFVTAFASWLWLGERFTRTQAICCVICIIGVMMVVDPFRTREPVDPDHGRSDGIPDTFSGKLLGVGIALVGILLRAPQCKFRYCLVVLVRYVGDRATTAQILTIGYIALAVAGPLLALVAQKPVTVPTERLGWSILGTLLIVWTVADCTITYAGQRTSPTTVSICAYASVIFANCIQWAIYGSHPSPVAMAGMIIVLVAGLFGVIYGPAGNPKEGDSADPLSETSRLLQDGGEPRFDRRVAIDPEV